MARVEADAEALVPARGLEQRHELVDRAPDRAAGAGRVLHQQPGAVARELEHLVERGNDAPDADVHPGAEMRAHVEDDGVRVDRVRDLHRVAHRRA